MAYSALLLAGKVVVVALASPCVSAGNASDAMLRGAVNKSVPAVSASKLDMRLRAPATSPTSQPANAWGMLVDPDAKKPMPDEGNTEHAEAVVTATLAVGVGKIASWLIAHKAVFDAAGSLVTGFYGVLQAGALTGDMLSQVLGYMSPSPNFERQVGNFGLPLTVAVVNDSPVNMRIVRHEVMKGWEFSYSSERQTLAPGDEAKWEAYTNMFGNTVMISIEVEFDDAAKTHTIINAVKHRRGSVWCDSLRGGDVFKGSWGNRWKYQNDLCEADTKITRSGNPYQLAFFVPA